MIEPRMEVPGDVSAAIDAYTLAAVVCPSGVRTILPIAENIEFEGPLATGVFARDDADIDNTTIIVTGNGHFSVTAWIGTDDAGVGEAAWTAPALGGAWVNLAPTSNAAGYRVDANGIVHLRGIVTGGNDGVNLFTLPAAYRPACNEIYPVMWRDVSAAADVLGRLTVLSSGVVSLFTNGVFGGAGDWVTLDGLTFQAAAAKPGARRVVLLQDGAVLSELSRPVVRAGEPPYYDLTVPVVASSVSAGPSAVRWQLALLQNSGADVTATYAELGVVRATP